MKQVKIIKTKNANKLEDLINEELALLPNGECITTFERAGGTLWVIMQYDK